MQKLRFILYLTFILLFSASCAGIPLPGTDRRLMDWPIESKRVAVNVTCIDLAQLNAVASLLEGQHIQYLQTQDNAQAIDVTEIESILGEECGTRLRKLRVAEIKTELFGDLQTITFSSKLRELGGLAFSYENVSTESGIEITLHLDEYSQGPRHRMVAIYRLEDNRVIHYNYSGTDNVDKRTRRWPIDEFFGTLINAAGKAIIP